MCRTERTIWALVALLAVVATVSCDHVDQSTQPRLELPAGRYTVSGGGSALPPVAALADAFTKLHPGVTFALEDVGSDAGVMLAANGTIDLGMISRDLTASEQGTVETLQVGLSGTGVIVNATNPLPGLSRLQVRNIFSGAITDWSQVGGPAGPISVIVREPGSSTRSTFESFVFEGERAYRADVIEVNEKGPMLNAVRGLQGAIGMATLSTDTLADPSVRFLAIDGIEPTMDSLRQGAYPIRRPLYLTYRATGLKAAVEAFLEFVRSPEGQRIIARF